MKKNEAVVILRHCASEDKCPDGIVGNCYGCNRRTALDMAIEALSEDKWIPIQYHEITEEEREENGFPKDWDYLLDCVMPQDDQEILVQDKYGVIRWDVCYEDDGFSLDSGLDWCDIVAWQPLPTPYKMED